MAASAVWTALDSRRERQVVGPSIMCLKVLEQTYLDIPYGREIFIMLAITHEMRDYNKAVISTNLPILT